MKTSKKWAWTILLAVFTVAVQLSTLAVAQDEDQDQSPDQDPPARVGRLDYSQGSVSFRPAGEDDWVTAVPNRPMVTGDDLWADEDSRAEVHIGSTALRLGAKTGITFLELDDHTTQIRLAQGSLIVRVRHVDDDDSYEVDTPNLAFTLMQPGEYRLDVSQDGSQTVTTVWHGRGRVTGGGLSYTVVANQSATFNGDEQHLDYDLGQISNRDGLDEWATGRDDQEDRSDSANYVSREMTGYEDLDEYGDWSYVAGYGPCWRPRAIVADWAPYRFGHWVYVGPWGWTWVEDEPWGFAPFHYGRWAFVSGGWFWVPGPVAVRPVWAPALVAFVGGGPGFRFSAGVGVGWFPLAPGEVYVPGYHVSRRYVNNVNITNTTVNVTRVTNVYNTVIVNKTTNVTYVNQHVASGVTVVSHETFVNARPVARNVMRVDAHEIASAPITHAAVVEPVRTSVVGAGRPVTVRPPAAVISRQVVAVRTPPAPPRPIEQRQAAAGGHLQEQSLVRPVGPSQPAQMNPGGNKPAGNQPAGNQSSGNQSPGNQEGFRPFNQQPNTQVKPTNQSQPRVYEAQGTPETHNPQPPVNRPAQPEWNRNVENHEFRAPNEVQRPVETHPLVRPAPPVQERTPQQEQVQEQKFNQWHEQRPATPPPQHTAPPPAQHTSPPPKQESKKK